MIADELRNRFAKDETRQPCALIEFENERGIAFMLGENLVSRVWTSGDVIVMWQDGEQTVLPEDFNLIRYGLYDLSND